MASIRIPLRAAGAALVVAGALFALAAGHPDILREDTAAAIRADPWWGAVHLGMFASASLSALGAVGLVAASGGRLGRAGDAALVVTLVGCAVAGPVMFLEAITLPPIAEHAPELLDRPGPMVTMGTLAFTGLSAGWPVGLGLLGWLGARSRAIPGGLGLAIGAGAFLAFGGPFVPVADSLSIVGFGAAIAWSGRWLLGVAASNAAPLGATREVATASR